MDCYSFGYMVKQKLTKVGENHDTPIKLDNVNLKIQFNKKTTEKNVAQCGAVSAALACHGYVDEHARGEGRGGLLKAEKERGGEAARPSSKDGHRQRLLARGAAGGAVFAEQRRYSQYMPPLMHTGQMSFCYLLWADTPLRATCGSAAATRTRCSPTPRHATPRHALPAGGRWGEVEGGGGGRMSLTLVLDGIPHLEHF